MQNSEQGSAKAEERSFRDYFSAQAEEYARHRPAYPQALFDYLATLAPALQRAWDCGTGNGQAALKLAEHFVEVIATEHEMVGFLASWSATRRYAKEEGQHPLEIVLDELRESWGQEDEKRRVQWTLYTRVGRLPR